MKKKILRLTILSLIITVVAVAVGTFFLVSDTKVSGQQQSRGWRIWVRTEPCSGRFDWLSVAKEQQGGGKNFYVPYETVMSAGGRCIRSDSSGCTFEEAKTLMEELRPNDEFLDYCCHDYSVWKDTRTDKKYVALVRTGTPGSGQEFVKGDLCCEEAEEIAETPGACSKGIKGNTGGGASGGFGGHWNIDTRFGAMEVELTQTGNSVAGTFSNAFASGSLDGTISGKTVRFKWRSGEDTGTAEVTLAADGKSFTGNWIDDATKTRVAMTGKKSP